MRRALFTVVVSACRRGRRQRAQGSHRRGVTSPRRYARTSPPRAAACCTSRHAHLPFYRYRSGATVTSGRLVVTFTNRVRIRAGVWQWTKKTFVWKAQRYGATAPRSPRPTETLQLDGNKVYWSAATGVAWRCVTDARGRAYVLSASSATGLGEGGLASAVASGLDVGRRASAVTRFVDREAGRRAAGAAAWS